MLTTTKRYGWIITLLVGVSLASSGTIYAQATNQIDRLDRRRAQSADVTPFNPFQVSTLTLTGDVLIALHKPNPQTLTELKWKLQYALDTENHLAALEYASLSVIGSPEQELQLLRAKAIALVKLNRIPDAIANLKYVLILEPNDLAIVNNIAELLLITGQVSDYQSFASKHKAQIERAYDGILSKYFSILEAYQTENEEQFRATATRFLASLPSKNAPLLAGWTFDDLLAATSRQPKTHKRAMLMNFILVLIGELNRDEALKMIEGL